MQIKSVKHAVTLLEKHDKNVEIFYDDPMTRAMGVPTGDFQESFDVEEREILAYIIENALDDSNEREMALSRFDKWLP